MRKKYRTAKPMSRCEQYARDVVTGKVVAGQLVVKAAKRFLKDLKRTDIYFDQKEADKIVTFAEKYLRLWEDKWRDKPVEIRPWMAFILQQIYGWYRKSDGKRRIRKVYIQLAKKNAKSTLAAIINLYHLFADQRINTPNVYVGANGEAQALICTNITGKILRQSPALMKMVDQGVVKMFKKKEKYQSIENTERDGFIVAMAKEPAKTDTAQSGSKHGINVSLLTIDEYSNADSANLLDTGESAQAARDEPLTIVITTASHKKNGPCFQNLRKTGIELLDGIIENDFYLPFIYEIDEPIGKDGKPEEITIDWLLKNEWVWEQGNPNIDVSVSREFLRFRLQEAKNEGGSKEVDVKIYSFNVWVDSPEVWIPADIWKKNTHKISEGALSGALCYGGLEIVSGLDLNAFLLYFPNIKGEIAAVKPFFWMAKGKVISNKMQIDCSQWVDRGLIKTTPGNVIDNEDIYDWILGDLKNYNLHSVAFNINLQNHDILQALIKAGIECNPISQGYRGVSEPSLAWEELCTSAKIEHFNNPVLAWMNSNCMVIRKENDIKVQRSNGRVAGISAAINALAQYKTIEAEPKDEDQLIEAW